MIDLMRWSLVSRSEEVLSFFRRPVYTYLETICHNQALVIYHNEFLEV